MIKIFGRQLFFKFYHLIYEFDLAVDVQKPALDYEIITDNIERIDMGYFSIRMLKKVLKNNQNKSDCIMFKAKDTADIVGFALVCYKGAREIHYHIKKTDAFITALGVFKECRGKGYSQEILRGVVDICKSKNLKLLKLSVDSDNHPAINAYEKFGFQKCGEKKFIRVASIDFLCRKAL